LASGRQVSTTQPIRSGGGGSDSICVGSGDGASGGGSREVGQLEEVRLFAAVLPLQVCHAPVVLHLLHTQSTFHLFDRALRVAQLHLQFAHPRLTVTLVKLQGHHFIYAHGERGACLARPHLCDFIAEKGIHAFAAATATATPAVPAAFVLFSRLTAPAAA
jgi:hypothetical protein